MSISCVFIRIPRSANTYDSYVDPNEKLLIAIYFIFPVRNILNDKMLRMMSISLYQTRIHIIKNENYILHITLC